MAARNDNSQLNLPPVPLETAPANDLEARKDAAAVIAAHLIEDALTDARISFKEAAYLIGCSDSLVRRWCSPLCRESPSFLQMLLLPPSFHIALHRRLNQRYRFDRAALTRIAEDLGDLAVLMP